MRNIIHPEESNLINNAKFILITLVILGHFIRDLGLHELRLIVYATHMYGFAFISGYLSKNLVEIKRWKKTLFRLIRIYLFGNVVFYIFARVVPFINDFSFNIFNPYHIMWYLYALIIWRFLVPLNVILNWKKSILLSIILCLVMGLFFSDVYSQYTALRLINFYPFFLVGLFFPLNKLRYLNRANKLISISLMIVAISMILLINIFAEVDVLKWLLGYYSFNLRGVFDPLLLGLKTLLTLISIMLLISLMSLVGVRRYWFTSRGENSMYAYLFHEIIGLPLTYIVVHNMNVSNVIYWQIGVIASTLLVVVVLTSDFWRKLFAYKMKSPLLPA